MKLQVADVSNRDNDEEKEEKGFCSPYPVTRLSPAFDLVDLAREVAGAGELLHVHTSGKLKILAEQMRALQAEARRILEEAKRNAEFHEAECGFQKKVGGIYHFYKKENGRMVCSILSPGDWAGRAPYAFVGSYRMENDMSWTEITDTKQKKA